LVQTKQTPFFVEVLPVNHRLSLLVDKLCFSHRVLPHKPLQCPVQRAGGYLLGVCPAARIEDRLSSHPLRLVGWQHSPQEPDRPVELDLVV
jgi:hypothetical protein